MDQDNAVVSAQAQVRQGKKIEDLSKQDIKALAGTYLTLSYETGVDTLKVVIRAKKMQEFWKQVLAQHMPSAIDQLLLHGKGGYTGHGTRLEVVETAVEFDYSDDHEWNRLNDEFNRAKEALKAHEEILKKLPLKGMGIASGETGEMYEARRPSRRASETIKATIK